MVSKKEQDYQNYIVIKDYAKNENIISLNMNSNGISVLGSNSDNHKNIEMETPTFIKPKPISSSDVVFQKDVKIMNMDNLQNALMDKLKNNRYNNYYDGLNGYDDYSSLFSGDYSKFFSFKSSDNKLNITNNHHNVSDFKSHPCFNRGYFIKEHNIIGFGNYSECLNYIERLNINSTLYNLSHNTLSDDIIESLKETNHVLSYLYR